MGRVRYMSCAGKGRHTIKAEVAGVYGGKEGTDDEMRQEQEDW